MLVIKSNKIYFHYGSKEIFQGLSSTMMKLFSKACSRLQGNASFLPHHFDSFISQFITRFSYFPLCLVLKKTRDVLLS